jgi:phosphoglycerate kinase
MAHRFLGTSDSAEISGKTVLVRVDYNVPLKQNGEGYEVESDARIRSSLSTLYFLQSHNCKVVLISHFGRPKHGYQMELSLYPIFKKLQEVLGGDVKRVKFCDDCIGDLATEEKRILNAGEILLLENLRFHNEEEEDKEDFAGMLAQDIDLYVNDAFSVCHRGIPKFFLYDSILTCHTY